MASRDDRDLFDDEDLLDFEDPRRRPPRNDAIRQRRAADMGSVPAPQEEPTRRPHGTEADPKRGT